jgi:hypothetical protein
MWYLGQKIVCINDRFPPCAPEWISEPPRKGQIYTIERMVHGKSIYTGKPKFGFRLKELPNGRCGFFAERFAPLLNLLDQACLVNISQLTTPPWIELPLTPGVRGVPDRIRKERFYECSSL